MEQSTLLSPKKQSEAIKILKTNNLIEVEKKGIPSKNYFEINYEKIFQVLSLESSITPKGIINQSSRNNQSIPGNSMEPPVNSRGFNGTLSESPENNKSILGDSLYNKIEPNKIKERTVLFGTQEIVPNKTVKAFSGNTKTLTTSSQEKIRKNKERLLHESKGHLLHRRNISKSLSVPGSLLSSKSLSVPGSLLSSKSLSAPENLLSSKSLSAPENLLLSKSLSP